MKRRNKNYKPRVVIPFNTGTRPHVNKKAYLRRNKHKKDLTND